jgi:DNA-directed RNA polymerase specialized sigma subunit
VGTKADNMLDKAAKGRAAHKLRQAQVESIGADYRTHRAIAAVHGISPSHVSRLKQQQCWKRIPSAVHSA